jgi:hypothetical protein
VDILGLAAPEWFFSSWVSTSLTKILVSFIFRIVIFVDTLCTHCPFTFRSQFYFSELMHAISIYKARVSGPWSLTSEQLNFFCTTCLIKDSVRTVEVVFPYLCFGKKSFNLSNTKRCPTCCSEVKTDASWTSSKVLDTKEGPDGKFS